MDAQNQSPWLIKLNQEMTEKFSPNIENLEN